MRGDVLCSPTFVAVSRVLLCCLLVSLQRPLPLVRAHLAAPNLRTGALARRLGDDTVAAVVHGCSVACGASCLHVGMCKP